MLRLLAATLILLCAGCVTAPVPLQGQFSDLLPAQAARLETTGAVVRWGGRIVSVEPQATRSCFEIIGLLLDARGEPRDDDRSEGRFFACRDGFYDPEVFQAGRVITITGTIEGYETHKVGDYDYRYPRVAAKTIYLWPVNSGPDLILAPPAPWYGYW